MNLLNVNDLVLDLDDPADLRVAAALGVACSHDPRDVANLLERCETAYVWDEGRLVGGRCKCCGSDLAVGAAADPELADEVAAAVARVFARDGRQTITVFGREVVIPPRARVVDGEIVD